MNTNTIVNLTPHNIVVVVSSETTTTFTSAGNARVGTSRKEVGKVGGIPLYLTTFGTVEGLPPEEEGVFLIVSALVRAACPGRGDLWSPGELVRDPQGVVVGCRGLTR